MAPKAVIPLEALCSIMIRYGAQAAQLLIQLPMLVLALRCPVILWIIWLLRGPIGGCKLLGSGCLIGLCPILPRGLGYLQLLSCQSLVPSLRRLLRQSQGSSTALRPSLRFSLTSDLAWLFTAGLSTLTCSDLRGLALVRPLFFPGIIELSKKIWTIDIDDQQYRAMAGLIELAKTIRYLKAHDEPLRLDAIICTDQCAKIRHNRIFD